MFTTVDRYVQELCWCCVPLGFQLNTSNNDKLSYSYFLTAIYWISGYVALLRRCNRFATAPVVVASRLRSAYRTFNTRSKSEGGHFVEYAKSQSRSDWYAAPTWRSRYYLIIRPMFVLGTPWLSHFSPWSSQTKLKNELRLSQGCQILAKSG